MYWNLLCADIELNASMAQKDGSHLDSSNSVQLSKLAAVIAIIAICMVDPKLYLSV